MRFNTPDNIVLNDGNILHWTNKDAIPFFVLSNGEIIECPKGIKHNDYIQSMFKDKNKERLFINSVMLQGRYWKKSNVFAFWNINDDTEGKIKYTVKHLSNSPYTSKIYYNHKIYELKIDELGYEWLQLIKSNKSNEDTVIDDKKKQIIEHWFDGNLNFIKRSYIISEKIGNKLRTRELNAYELLAATCFQVWADFFMNPNSKFDKFTLDDFMLFIDLKFHGRTSFKELFDYFHNKMRKKMIPKHEEQNYQTNEMELNNEFEELMTEYDFSDTEYSIINYENSNEPYSCNIKTQDYEKISNFLNSIKKDNKFIIDRANSRKINDNISLYTLRVRKNPMIKESLNEYYYDNNEIATLTPRISKPSETNLTSKEAHKALSKEITFKNNMFTAYKCKGEYGYFYEVKNKSDICIRFTTHDDYAPENIGDVKFLYKGKIYILDTNKGKIRKE